MNDEAILRKAGRDQRRLHRLRGQAGDLLRESFWSGLCMEATEEEAKRIIEALKPVLERRKTR